MKIMHRIAIGTIAGLMILSVVIVWRIDRETEFKKPLTAEEIETLEAITAARGQDACNWQYDDTSKLSWLREKYVAQWKADRALVDRSIAARQKYANLTPKEACQLLDRFPDMVERHND
ncbi:hypothetical protein [Rhizobium sp. C4]|uniref:hypothetical protein n=1 Tax=Rhizobium sp. C4 TaxID=1349800 RepID=UPI001E501B73|nr:hypothetical protein [Rhizobium sp. C4]MCD2172567.1 hypothetical protein [Rhizobium sp. C4]